MTTITRKEVAERSRDYREILEKEWHHDHEIVRHDL
jgi:hypothetical protein